MSKKGSDTLLVIDPVKKTITPQKVAGLPANNWVLGAVTPDGDKMVICGLANSKSAVLDLTADPVTATLQNPPGAGGWYDWSYHPVDGRLYAVDGKDGSLLYADPSKDPQKVVLKEGVFPEAQAGSSGFASHSAVFFEERGRLTAKLLNTGEAVPVRRWRIVFDEVEDAVVKTEAAKVTKGVQDHRFVLDTPGDDHVIAAGEGLNVDLRLYVPKATPLKKPYELGHLAARRLA
ncbi:hypothetical protein ABZZ20_19220 [Streptomyces sp. NPDC006430]|uniref:hypothetical protein n=1 Tax=Streptomyces sp. NPDC006430 TaxID=3154299 RepID=UPI0033A37EBE